MPLSQEKKLSPQKFLCACPSLHSCYKRTKFSTNPPSLARCILLHLPLHVAPALRSFQADSGNGSMLGCPRTGCCTWRLGQGLEATKERAMPFHHVAFVMYLPPLVWPLQKILIRIYWQLAGDDDDDKNNCVYTYTQTCTSTQVHTNTPRVHTNTLAHISAHTDTQVHTNTQRYTHTPTHRHIQVHAHQHTQVYTHRYTPTHTGLHTHLLTIRSSSSHGQRLPIEPFSPEAH